MNNLFSINTIVFTFMGYPMSYIEFFGTVFNLACVWLAAKNKISNWPIGIVGIVLYLSLFYQVQLYSDFFEQIYFLVMSFYGWYVWANIKGKNKDKEGGLKISYNTALVNVIYLVAMAAGTIGLTYFMARIHIYFPKYFPVAASYPLMDAFTTVMSFAATILMARKKVECWYLWILVDVIGIWLYYVKGVKFIALEYVIFLVMATSGLVVWMKEYRGYKKPTEEREKLGRLVEVADEQG